MLARVQIHADIKANKQQMQLWQNLDIFHHFHIKTSHKKYYLHRTNPPKNSCTLPHLFISIQQMKSSSHQA